MVDSGFRGVCDAGRKKDLALGRVEGVQEVGHKRIGKLWMEGSGVFGKLVLGCWAELCVARWPGHLCCASHAVWYGVQACRPLTQSA